MVRQTKQKNDGNKRRYITDSLVSLGLCMAFSAFALLSLILSTTFSIPNHQLVLMALSVTLVIFLVFRIKQILIGVLILFGVGLIAAAVLSIFRLGLAATWKQVEAFAVFLWNCILGENIILTQEELVAAFAICLPVCIFSVLFIDRFERPIFLFFFDIIVFASQVITGSLKTEIHLVLLLGVTILATLKLFNRQAVGGMKNFRELWRIFIPCILITALVVGVALNLPFNQFDPIDTNFFASRITHAIFSISDMGFGEEDGKLGGDVSLDETQIMRMEADERLYLIGSVKTNYTGRAWERPKAKYQPYTNQRKNADRFQLAQADAALVEKSAIVELAGVRTSVLFTPRYLNEIRFDEIRHPRIDITTDVVSVEEPMTTGDRYFFRYYSDAGLSVPEDTNADKEVPKFYLQIPKSQPARVKALAGEITASRESDYQKALAIKAYLRQYPYTLTPGKLPEGRDFVDYFLFEGQAGYCTYFATAMVMLCRQVGIPARYIEGYITPMEYAGTSGDRKSYVITNHQAHAWAEIYLQNIGWTRIEATPPFDALNQNGAADPSLFVNEMLQDPNMARYLYDTFRISSDDLQTTAVPTQDTQTGTLNPSENTGTATNTATRPPASQPSEPLSEEPIQSLGKKASASSVWKVLIFLLVAAALLIPIGIHLYHRNRQHGSVRLSPGNAVGRSFGYLFRLFRLTGFIPLSDEAVGEQILRGLAGLGISNETAKGIAGLYHRYRFGKYPLTAADAAALQAFYRSVRKDAAGRIHPVKRFFFLTVLRWA